MSGMSARADSRLRRRHGFQSSPRAFAILSYSGVSLCEVKEAEPVLLVQHLVQACHLIGNKRVHRIQNEASHPGRIDITRVAPESGENWKKKGLGFTCARTSRNDERRFTV